MKINGYSSFEKVFPELALAETVTVQVTENPSNPGKNPSMLPAGYYIFEEHYCHIPDCDCCRLMMAVYDQTNREYVSIISYGWESVSFYQKWLGAKKSDDAKQMAGAFCEWIDFESGKLDAQALFYFNRVLLQTPGFKSRIIKHYKMVKGLVKNKENTPRFLPWRD